MQLNQVTTWCIYHVVSLRERGQMELIEVINAWSDDPNWDIQLTGPLFTLMEIDALMEIDCIARHQPHTFLIVWAMIC